jgi:aspartyl-tRNA synthetase
MKLTASDISEENLNKEIEVYGIVFHVREIGKKKFIILTDGKSILQVVYEGDLKVKRGDSIKVKGIVLKDERAPRGVEVRAKEVLMLNEIEEESFDEWSLKRMSLDKKIKYRSISMRIPEEFNTFLIYSKVLNLLREFALKKGLLEIVSPKVVYMGTESGSEVFSILYFDKEAYLAQSNQLYKQMILACGYKGVFEIGSYYRAEVSRTTRHLTEFRIFDVELNYVEDMNEILDFIREMIEFVFKNLNLEKPEFETITFKDAKEILLKNGIKIKDDLTTEAEEKLYEILKKDFIFVTEFPFSARPFYTMKKNEYSYSFDLLFKGLEIISGAKREHRYKILYEQIKEKNINPERLFWYLEAFKHGIPPHGGFGFGVERFVKQLLNKENIREVTLYPRDPDTILP